MIFHDLPISPAHQAHVFATGLLTLLTLGTLATIALCLAAIWLFVQFATLLLTSIVECCSTLGATYQAADPLIRFLILLALGFALYHLARRIRRESR